ncbi:MAG: sensor histidine kinase, partial [Flavobacteriales bacterium]
MRFATLYIAVLLCTCCIFRTAQAQPAQQLDVVDSLLLRFQWRTADTILEHLFTTNLSIAEEAEAKLYKARVLEKLNEMDKATVYALDALESSTNNNLSDIAAGTHITLSLIQERVGQIQKASTHLDDAEKLLFENKLEHQYAHYYVRRSSLIRVSTQDPDSIATATELALLANKYATKYNQPWHLADSHLLLSSYYKRNLPEYMVHRKAATDIFVTEGDYISGGYMLLGLAEFYSDLDSHEQAFTLYDSAVMVHLMEKPLPSSFYEGRATLFKNVGMYDSAFANLQLQYTTYANDIAEQKRVEVAQLNAVAESEKKQLALENQVETNKKQETILTRTIVFLVLITIALVLLFAAYGQLKSRNIKIRKQSEALETSLQRQKVLLAEVQHRVKNNLQVIIGLLDLQNEAPNNKTVQEITYESQKRIESMAFLHDKIYLSEDLDQIDLPAYLDEVANLMQTSYSTEEKPVSIEIESEITSVSIDKAIPLGLITV